MTIPVYACLYYTLIIVLLTCTATHFFLIYEYQWNMYQKVFKYLSDNILSLCQWWTNSRKGQCIEARCALRIWCYFISCLMQHVCVYVCEYVAVYMCVYAGTERTYISRVSSVWRQSEEWIPSQVTTENESECDWMGIRREVCFLIGFL